MNEHDNIDPALLGDDNPGGLDPHDAVNGGLDLKNKPRGIRRINKKGLLAGAALLGGAAIIAATTFNQAGSGASNAAKDAIAHQDTAKPTDLKRDALWYANVPDKVAAAEPAAPAPAQVQAGAQPGASAPAGPAGVPNLTGQAVNPLAAATAPRTAVPDLAAGGRGAAANGQQLTPAQQQAEQMAAQAEQQQQQALATAMKSGLAAQGFGSSAKPGGAGAAAIPTAGVGAGAMPAGYQLPPAAGGQAQDDQNMQGQKDKFMKGASAESTDYSPSVKTAPRSPYELKAGSIIPAVMIGGINSDLPGEVIAQVRENVYDTKTGRRLLIPQGSRLVGLYDAHVAYGQQRILLAWNRIIYPDGSSFDLKAMPGADVGGYAGFFDQVDNHYLKIFGSAVMMSLISAGVQLSQPNNGSSSNPYATPTVSQTVGAALGQQIGQTAMNITQKNLNIQPTLTVRPGYLFNVMVTADMILPPQGR